MSIIIEILLFVVAVLLTIWWISLIILPIAYGIPRSIYLIAIKKNLRPIAVLAYLASPILWSIILLLIAFVIAFFLPNLSRFLIESAGFGFGQFFGILLFLFRLLSKDTWKDMDCDFQSFIQPYLK